MTKWPYSEVDHGGYVCHVCGELVKTDNMIIDQYGHRIYFPASLYWNESKSEVYCCPEHSLEGHKDNG